MGLARLAICTAMAVALAIGANAADKRATAGPVFSVSFPKAKSAAPIDGRLLLLLSTDPIDEPRNQITHEPSTQIVFGEPPWTT